MATVDQSTPAPSQIASTLQEALSVLSDDQTVCFTKYRKLVLPVDGYVFWVKADLISPSAVFNTSPGNSATFSESEMIAKEAPVFSVHGSLHHSVDVRQAEDETLAVNRVVFTTPTRIQDFERDDLMTLWLGSFTPPGGHESIRFAFSSIRNFYTEAGLWHYIGDAVYPAMETQIVDDPRFFDIRNVIVSNSLPIWLGLPLYQQPYDNGIYPPGFPLYPSYLVPDNAEPPYASVHIAPEGTRALQAVPRLNRHTDHDQLVADQVRITFYGLRNFNALDFQDFLFQFSVDTGALGIMNMPVIRDEKRSQTELGAIAMKKSFEVEVSYYQSRVRNIARAVIASAIPSYSIGEFGPTVGSGAIGALIIGTGGIGVTKACVL